jgi:putative acetyltransferase
MITIRVEAAEDVDAVWRVNEAAFGRAGEADLVDALRRRGAVILSLVAEQEGAVVGHILFSPVTISDGDKTVTAVGLGPMAVAPGYQGMGIGSQLVEAGIAWLREAGHRVVIVLGHPEYYPRFGFVLASRHGIRWENEVPEDVFMALALHPGGLAGVRGVVRYQPEFGGV